MKISYVIRPLIAMTLTSIIASCGIYTSSDDKQYKSENLDTTTQNDTSKKVASINNKDASNKIETHAPFFTYSYSHGPEIEPAMGGKLILKEDCLLLDNGETISVPVFPHGITSWDEEKQTLTANGVEIPLNGELFTNSPLASYEYSADFNFDFVQEGDRECLKDRKILILGSQFMDINDYPHLKR